MSDETKAAIQTALEDHLRDEGLLDAGELVTDWLVLSAALPAERTPDEDSLYNVVTADHMMAHHSLGLAAWYLHDRHDCERR